MPPGPPYIPDTAGLGGRPTVALDVPISAVFVFLFVCLAGAHMVILQANGRRGHKYAMSGVTFGFCSARIVTNVMRIVWATHLTNVSVAIAAQVFVAAGVILLFIINAVWAQRVLRAAHPKFGWGPVATWFFRGVWIVIFISFGLLVSLTVESFFTLDPHIHAVARDIQLYGQAAFTLVAFLPIPLALGALLAPRPARVDKFGTGRWRTKIAVLLFSSALLTLGAGFRLGSNAMPPRPETDPAWYQSKACFYVFNFAIEVIVVALYAVVRVDKRFHVPDGSKGPGDYSGTSHPAKDHSLRILAEEQVFDHAPAPPEEVQDRMARSTAV